MPDLTGTTLGRYRLLERRGRGGMAEVYRAYQPSLDRDVAIKVMHGYLADDPGFVGRFKREAKAIAALRHPHIVQVYDFDAEGDVYYMVMEYIAGETLKARLEGLHAAGRSLSLEEVEAILRPLGEALDYAHAQGCVHRDIKPANIMFDGPRLVLADFGIATIVGGTCYTAPGAMVGTPAYMSPEQCRGEPGDARSDIYSLGIVLYEMVTGQLPFDADTPLAIVLKHLNDPLPLPSRVVEGLPPAVEHVVLKALAKAADDRYPDVRALADDLAAAVQGQAAAAPAGVMACAVAPPAPQPAAPAGPVGTAARPAPPAVAAGTAAGPAGGKRLLAAGGRWPIWAWGSVIVVLLLLVPLALLTPGLGRPALAPSSPPEAARERPPAEHLVPPEAEAPPAAPGEPADLLEHFTAGLAALREDGDPERAIAELTAAIADDPQLAEAYFWRGIAYWETGRHPAAIADLTQAIALAPDWAEAYYERGRVYMYGEPIPVERAYADLSRAIELDVGYAAAYALRGHLVYNYMEDIAGGLADLDACVAWAPDWFLPYYHRGLLYKDLGQNAAARADLRLALDLAPDDDWRRQVQEELDTLLP